MEFNDLEENRQRPNVERVSIEYMLKVIKNNNLKKVLEVGCFNGYSALMFSTAAESVKSIEIDKKNIEIAKENFRKYKCENIEILEGDAKNLLKILNEKFDLIFIDAIKNEYKEYLQSSLKLINKGFIYLDNTISHKEKMGDLFIYLQNSNLKWKELNIGRGLIEIKI